MIMTTTKATVMSNGSSKSHLSKADLSLCSKASSVTETTLPMDDDDDSDNDTLGDLVGMDDLEKEMLNFRIGRTDKRDSVRPGTTAPPSSLSPRRKPRKISGGGKGGSLSPKRNRNSAGPAFQRSKTLMTPQERQRAAHGNLRRAKTLNDMDNDNASPALAPPAPPQQQSPEDCLSQILQKASPNTLKNETWAAYFSPVTADRVQAHSLKVSHAIRHDRLPTLQQLHRKGLSLNGCNSHGESMIHLACRLGRQEIVEYMLDTANVSLRVQDDTGRTPFHDLCWTNKPNFELIKIILQHAPELLFVHDKRGYSALKYIPPSCWNEWCEWFTQEQAWIQLKVNHSGFAHTRDVLNQASERLHLLLQRAAEYE